MSIRLVGLGDPYAKAGRYVIVLGEPLNNFLPLIDFVVVHSMEPILYDGFQGARECHGPKLPIDPNGCHMAFEGFDVVVGAFCSRELGNTAKIESDLVYGWYLGVGSLGL